MIAIETLLVITLVMVEELMTMLSSIRGRNNHDCDVSANLSPLIYCHPSDDDDDGGGHEDSL